MKIKRVLFIILLFSDVSQFVFSQEINVEKGEKYLSYEEYIAYVKKHHPLAKQANLMLNSSEAKLLKSRGGFDPKVAIDYASKDFKKKDYYDLLNATFKIPTWYGVEFKANYEKNSGLFLNPENNVPTDGLYNAGLKLSVLEGLLANDRMATLKKAKYFVKQTKAERELVINTLLYEATNIYLKWAEAANASAIYNTFIGNASQRFKATKRAVEVGDKAGIDSVESKNTIQLRKLDLEVAILEENKARLKASNFLWIDDIPLAIENNIKPLIPEEAIIENSLFISGIVENDSLVINHPKIRSLNYKIKSLEVDKRLKLNRLLPKFDVNYNFISPQYQRVDGFDAQNYKSGFVFSTPLFLRKERGDLKLAKFKLQDVNFERQSQQLQIRNKVEAAFIEMNSLKKQQAYISDIIETYTTLVNAEQRKFFIGESSLFLINSRESKLIDARLKQNKILIKQLNTRAKIFNALGISAQ